MGLLDDIIAQKRSELPELRARRLPEPPPLVRPLLHRDPGEPLKLICEFKRRSPSAGELSSELAVTTRAQAYENAGASMISVLCDQTFFGGSYEDLAEARRATRLPLLCKEFILEECQLDAALCYGASAALLIVRCLEPDVLARLITAAQARNLVPLVEVTNETESRVALDAGARYFGVNARDLDTLTMDGDRARRVLEALPESMLRCHFSGVKSADSVTEVAGTGADAALVGESLMREANPTALLRSFVQAARGRLS